MGKRPAATSVEPSRPGELPALLSNSAGVVYGILLVVASALGLIKLMTESQSSPFWIHYTSIFWILWATGPPFFFLLQWSLFDKARLEEPHWKAEFDKMKYSHELASKFWLGGVAVLSGVLIQAYHLGIASPVGSAH